METHATVKGQIVIPVALRRKYGIRKGTRIHIRDEEGQTVLQPITREHLRRLRGSLKGTGVLESLMAERHWEREREDAPKRSRVR